MAKVLIIEDSEPIRRYFAKVIQGMGHETVEACDGQEGFAQASSGGWALIVCDLHLPKRPTGMDLIRQVRRTVPECPVVIVSGYPTDDVLEEARQLGITDFLTKPFEVSFLRSVIGPIIGDAGSGG